MQRVWSISFAQRTALNGWTASASAVVMRVPFDREPLVVPLAHAALQIRHALEPEADEDRRTGRAAYPRATDDDGRPFLAALDLASALRQLLQRNQHGADDVAELAVELLGLAHVKDNRLRPRGERCL